MTYCCAKAVEKVDRDISPHSAYVAVLTHTTNLKSGARSLLRKSYERLVMTLKERVNSQGTAFKKT